MAKRGAGGEMKLLRQLLPVMFFETVLLKPGELFMQFIASAAIFGFRLGCENGGHQLEKERLP